MKPAEPAPVKLLCGILYSSPERMQEACRIMERCWGAIDFVSGDFLFDVSDYYVPEMGKPISRRFISFTQLIQPNMLASVKISCNEIEDSLAGEGNRLVNLDPGYLDFDKLVLASAKYNGQKIYLDHGIWADLTLQYRKGRFEAYPWTFPDFTSGRYNEPLLRIRTLYKRAISASSP
ncbi:DUF4416 family protein [bacterium]|nr:DUF4416 family protein [bacterium]